MRASKLRRIRRRRIVMVIAALMALHALAGFWLVPAIVKAQAVSRLTEVLKRPVSIARVDFNPYTLTLGIDQLDIREPDGAESFVGWEKLVVDFEIISLVSGEWRFRAVELTAPHANVVVHADGSLNFSDLLAPLERPAGTEEPVAARPAEARVVRIDRFALSGARLDFRDEGRSEPFTSQFGPISFEVSDFQTAGANHAPYRFEAATESGEKLAWTGWIQAAPFASKGELTLADVVLRKYAPYYAEKTGVEVQDGRLTVRGRYDVSFDQSRRKMQLIEGSLDLRDLKLVERASGGMLLDLPVVAITGAAADGLALSASVGKVDLPGGRLRVRREKDGTLNLANLLRAPGDAPAATGGGTAAGGAASPAAPGLKFHLGEAALRDWRIELLDEVPATPATLAASGVQASIKNFSLEPGVSLPVQLACEWQAGGKVSVAGRIALDPLTADLDVNVDSLALAPLSTYVEEHANARIADGRLSIDGHASLAPGEGRASLDFSGQTWLEQLEVVDPASGGKLAGLSDLIVNGVKIETAPALAVSVDEINLTKPSLVIERGADGVLNWARIAREAPAKAGVSEPVLPTLRTEPLPAGPKIEVKRVVVVDGEGEFRDESTQPNARLGVAGFGGTVTGLSSDHPGRGEIALEAKVNGAAPLRVKGRLDPLGPSKSVDLTVDSTRIDLRPLSPYSGRYAGFELASGRLSLAIAARLADRNLNMENKATLDGFAFGKRVDSPEATKLPVRLGVALLKDAGGQIVLDVPVRGNLDDPEFKVGRIVLRVITNLLTKVATSPFSLLGAVVGRGGDSFKAQEFAAGSAALSATVIGNLESLAQALAARPEVGLEIAGGFDPEADTKALREAKFAGMIRAAALAARTDAGMPVPSSAELALSQEDYAATVKAIFDRRFPPGTALGTPLPAAPLIAPPPARQEAGFFRRLIDVLTMRESREQAAYEREQKRRQEDYMTAAKAAVETGLPLEEMKARLLALQEVSETETAALANARAQTVHDFLVGQKSIAPERVVIGVPASGAATIGAKVELQLR